jgi:hypothetical protein
MDLDRWRLVERVLDRALASDPSAWPALIDDLCSGDLDLRGEVEALLAQRSAAEQFLASPPSVAASALVEALDFDKPVDVVPSTNADVIPSTNADVILSEAKDLHRPDRASLSGG